MEIKIRNARPEDVEAVLKIFHTTWLATYPNKEHGITEEDIQEKFKDSYTPENIEKRRNGIINLPSNERYLVAETEEKVVGLCRVVLHNDKNQLQAIYVLPEFQGKGVGKALWNEVKKSFDPQKPAIVQVATYNTRAIEFYKGLGFKEIGKFFTEERHRMKSGNVIPETELLLS